MIPIPIPIPIFYKKLEMAYVGIDGFEMHSQISFPKPEVDIAEIFKLLTKAKDFLFEGLPPEVKRTPQQIRKWVEGAEGESPILLDDGQYGIKLSERKQSTLCDTSLNAGPIYLMLPRYVGPQAQNVYSFDYKEVAELTTILKKYIKDHNEQFKSATDVKIEEQLINSRLLRNKQFLTDDHFKKSVRQAIEADLEIFGIQFEEPTLRTTLKKQEFKDLLANIKGTKDSTKDKETLQKGYHLTDGRYVLKQDARESEIRQIVKYYRMEEDLEISPMDTLVNLRTLSPAKKKQLGQFIGLQGNITLPSIREIINTSHLSGDNLSVKSLYP